MDKQDCFLIEENFSEKTNVINNTVFIMNNFQSPWMTISFCSLKYIFIHHIDDIFDCLEHYMFQLTTRFNCLIFEKAHVFEKRGSMPNAWFVGINTLFFIAHDVQYHFYVMYELIITSLLFIGSYVYWEYLIKYIE